MLCFSLEVLIMLLYRVILLQNQVRIIVVPFSFRKVLVFHWTHLTFSVAVKSKIPNAFYINEFTFEYSKANYSFLQDFNLFLLGFN
jgi:hypothetical protein